MKHSVHNDSVYGLELNVPDFTTLAQIIENESGIKMPDHKRVLVQGRLRKRIHQLGLSSYGEYCNYLQSKEHDHEIFELLSAISTNKTDFFREPQHFSMLEKQLIPNLLETQNEFKFWSAGCSTGEEAFTIAITMEELKHTHPQIHYSIHASDISINVLQQAKRAEFSTNKTDVIKTSLLKRYFLKHRNKAIKKVRIVPELRKNVTFSYLNFMDIPYKIDQAFDFIFLRNVLIYFQKDIQKQVLHQIIKHLKPKGYLFLGHSETIFGYGLNLRSVGPNIYQKQ